VSGVVSSAVVVFRFVLVGGGLSRSRVLDIGQPLPYSYLSGDNYVLTLTGRIPTTPERNHNVPINRRHVSSNDCANRLSIASNHHRSC
jgi:hypothetical protein